PDPETPPVRVSYAGEAGVSLADPGIAWAEGRVSYEIEWPDVTVGSDAHGRLESDAETWHVLLELRAREGDEVIHVRRWEKRFPRKLQQPRRRSDMPGTSPRTRGLPIPPTS